MGFPRGDDGARLYKEKGKDGGYVLVVTEGNGGGNYDAVANVHPGPSPTLASTSVSRLYLLNKCKRIQWDDLPDEWENAFLAWMKDWSEKPWEIRGFWKVGNQPQFAPIKIDPDMFRGGIWKATAEKR